MPTHEDRKAFEEAIKQQDSTKIRQLLQRDDAKELLLMKDGHGFLPIHDACWYSLDSASLQLILDAAVKHGVAKEMLEEKTDKGWTCLHLACWNNLSSNSLRLLLEHLLKHTDIKKVLEEKNNDGWTCLHLASRYKLSADSLRLLLEYLPKHADVKKILEEKADDDWTCLSLACYKNLSSDSLRLLLDYLSKHADIKKVLNNSGWTCLHWACINLSSDSFRLLLDYLSKHVDIKKVLEEKNNEGWTCLHVACSNNLSADSFRLFLEYSAKYANINKVLEKTSNSGETCLHVACANDLSPDSFRLLLEHLTKHADIKKVLEAETKEGATFLHYACKKELFTDTLRLVVSFFPSNESFQLVLTSKNRNNKAPLDLAETEEYKQLLKDPNCWRKCRYWLFCKYQDTFLNSLYPNSHEKTLEALTELQKSFADDETLKKAVSHQQNVVEALLTINRDEPVSRQALELEAMSTFVRFHEDFHRDVITRGQNAEFRQLITDVQKLNFAVASHIALYDDESTARHACELEALSTTEDFHRSHILQLENADVRPLFTDFQRLKRLSEEEVDRRELDKLIFDRLSLSFLMKEALSILFEHGVTKESFFLLNENHLKEMGVKVGPRVQLLQIIEQETSRRNNLSARTDISCRPRSSGHTPRIGEVPPIALSGSALIQRFQQQQLGNAPPLQTASKDGDSDEQRSFVPSADAEVVSLNGGTEHTANSEQESWKSSVHSGSSS